MIEGDFLLSSVALAGAASST